MTYTDTDPPRDARGYGSVYSGPYRGGYRYSAPPRQGFSILRLLRNGEAWLDERGRGAWIAAMILGLIFFWPIGLALLAYMIWSKRMFRGFCGHRQDHRSRFMHRGFGLRSSGNSAFDAYREETLRRLEEEQEAFESFLERLRAAKDKQEFDSFMEERVARAKAEASRRSEDNAEPGRDA